MNSKLNAFFKYSFFLILLFFINSCSKNGKVDNMEDYMEYYLKISDSLKPYLDTNKNIKTTKERLAGNAFEVVTDSVAISICECYSKVRFDVLENIEPEKTKNSSYINDVSKFSEKELSNLYMFRTCAMDIEGYNSFVGTLWRSNNFEHSKGNPKYPKSYGTSYAFLVKDNFKAICPELYKQKEEFEFLIK